MRSLNLSFRKRENERIDRENHNLALRLIKNQGSISKRSLEMTFQINQHYAKMIQKVKKGKPIFQGRFKSLPPIKNRNLAFDSGSLT
jgi:hypothetical protein